MARKSSAEGNVANFESSAPPVDTGFTLNMRKIRALSHNAFSQWRTEGVRTASGFPGRARGGTSKARPRGLEVRFPLSNFRTEAKRVPLLAKSFQQFVGIDALLGGYMMECARASRLRVGAK